MSDSASTPLRSWLRERRRRNGPGIKAVYPRKNVVSLAGWRWAKASQAAEFATDKFKLARAELRSAEDGIIEVLREEIDLIASAVLERLGKHSLAEEARKDSRGWRSRRAKSKK